MEKQNLKFLAQIMSRSDPLKKMNVVYIYRIAFTNQQSKSKVNNQNWSPKFETVHPHLYQGDED